MYPAGRVHLHWVDREGHETTGFDLLAVRVNFRQSILLG